MVGLDHQRLSVDHVLLAVDDLDHAAAILNDRYGLGSAEGGRHPQWGTANRIVPVGDVYLELIAVVDPTRAHDSTFGRWIERELPGIMRPLGWAVRTTAVDDVARRLALAIESGSRATPDGRTLRWKLAGVEEAAADPALPFFIEWGADTPHPSRLPVTHRAGSVAFERLEILAPDDRLERWLGVADLPVHVAQGSSAVARIVLTVDGRELALSAITD